MGNGSVVLGLEGQSDPVHVIVATFDGSYGISGEVDASDCDHLYVSVALQDAFGQTSAAATELLGSCGTHVVDLVLEP